MQLFRNNILVFLLFIHYSVFSQTFSSGTNVSIPDCGSQVCSSINVSGLPSTINGTFGLEQVCIKINHTYDADLDIYLVAPDGTIVELSTDNGGSGDNYGSGTSNNNSPYTCFTMTSSTSITSGSAPFTSGPYLPEGNLGDVNNGQNPNGTWQLCVTDDACSDDGFINYWEIKFSNTPAPPGAGAPANNDCSNATPLTCGSVLTAQTTNGATANGSITGCSLGKGVWYSFTPITNQTVTVTADPASGYDIELAVAYGSCASMTNIACKDVGLSGDPETVTFNATAGVTYFFYIAHYSNTSNATGIFDISLSCGASACPTNATISSIPFSASGQTTCGAGDDFSSSDACGSSYMNGDDYVYTYTPITNECISITLSNTGNYVGVFVTDACPNLAGANCIASATSSSGNPFICQANLIGGTTYYITISTWPSPQCTPFDISITNCSCSPPINDECMNAIPVTVNTSGCVSSVSGTVNCATLTTNPPNTGCSGTADDDVWFSFVAPATGSVNINLFNVSGSTTDLYHSVWTGSCPSLSLVTGSCSDPNSSTLSGLTPGQTYYLRVYTYTSTGCQNTSFDVCINETGPCGGNGTNDYCEDPAVLTPGGSFTSNTSSSYTADTPGNLNSIFCGTIENNSWYIFTATSTTHTFNFTVSNCASNFGIQAEVYAVTTDINGCCANFTSVSNCWNPTTPTSGTVTATGLTVGQTYILHVDGYAGDDCDFTISGWSATGVLPIELISFEGKSLENANLLEWVTASEINNKAFFIERSIDGKLYETIGRVNGRGNSHTLNFYSYTDDIIENHTSYYYRLKQLDFDGKVSYSDIIYLKRNRAYIEIYPNPTKEYLNIYFQNLKDKNLYIKIMDIFGKNIYSSIHYIPENLYTINLFDKLTIASGVFFINIYDEKGNFLFSEKFIKE